jgi:hypothetical protein
MSQKQHFRSNLFEHASAVSIDTCLISDFRRIVRQYGRKALFQVALPICTRRIEFHASVQNHRVLFLVLNVNEFLEIEVNGYTFIHTPPLTFEHRFLRKYSFDKYNISWKVNYNILTHKTYWNKLCLCVTFSPVKTNTLIKYIKSYRLQ